MHEPAAWLLKVGENLNDNHDEFEGLAWFEWANMDYPKSYKTPKVFSSLDIQVLIVYSF